MSAVLALHGFTGRGDDWRFLAPSLPAGVALAAPDLLGHGTAVAVPSTSFDDEVDRLAALVADRPPRSVVLAGYSLGARLGLGLLVRHRERFAGAVLVGVHPGLEDPAERAARLRADEEWAELLEREGIDAFVERWERLPLFASQARLPAGRREAQRASRRAQVPRGLARALRVLGLGAMPPLWTDLPRLDLELRLVVGEEDVKFRDLAGRAAALASDARVVAVPAVGHNVALEAPAAVAAEVIELGSRRALPLPTAAAARGRAGVAGRRRRGRER